MVNARAAAVGTVDDGEDVDESVSVKEDGGPFSVSGLACPPLFPLNSNSGAVSEQLT